MRVVGIDLGAKRIGVAVSDADGRLATPWEVITRCDRQSDHRAIASVVAEAEAEMVVVGLPLSLDGSEGPAAKAARAEVAELARVLSVPVGTYDERLTTVTAERSLREIGMKGQARRRVIDKVAAAVMLQAWLDGQQR